MKWLRALLVDALMALAALAAAIDTHLADAPNCPEDES